MAGPRRLTASRDAARPDSRSGHKPLKNYKPALERLWKTGDVSSAPPKLAAPYKKLVESARQHGVEKEVDRVMSTFFSLGNENKISILTMERLDRLICTSSPEQLKQKLNMCNTLMGEFKEAADTMPALLAGSKRLTSSGRLDLNSMKRVIRRGIRRSKSLCPKEISSTIKTEVESGRMDDIQGVAEVRREQALAVQAPALAIQTISIQPSHTQESQPAPQPALQSIPKPQEVRTEPCMEMQTKSQLSPLQLWEEVRKIREGDKKPPKKPFVAGRVREEPADKRRVKPPQAAPVRIIKLKRVRPTPAPADTAHVKPVPVAKCRKPPEKKKAAPRQAAAVPIQASAETEVPASDAFRVHQPLIIAPDQEKKSDDDDKPGPSDRFAGGMGLKVKRKPKKKRSEPRSRRTKRKAPEEKRKPKKKKARRKAKKNKAAKKKPARKAKPKAKKKTKPRKKPKPKARKKSKPKPKKKKRARKASLKKGRKKRKSIKESRKRSSAKRNRALKTAKKRTKSRRKRKASAKKKKGGKMLIRRFRDKKKRRRKAA